MPLDEVARRYADTLFIKFCEESRPEYEKRKVAVTADMASRGLQTSGPFLNALMELDLERMKNLAQARSDTLLAAYAKAQLPIDDDVVGEILAAVQEICNAQSGNIVQAVRTASSRVGTSGGVDVGIARMVAASESQVVAQVRRTLFARRDEAILDSRGKTGEKGGDLDDLLPIFTKRQFEKDMADLAVNANSSVPLSLLFMDLDHFKSVNDSFNHLVGDEVLKETAKALKGVCASKGRCYRWGGEEFAVLLPNYSLDEAAVLAERIRQAISLTKFENYPHCITTSIGAATYPETTRIVGDLVGNADMAMMEAKRAGRNRVHLEKKATEQNSGSETPETRISDAEISKRVDAVRVYASIVSGRAVNFLITVQNDSDDEVTVKEVELLSGDDIRLTDGARQPEKNLWICPPRARVPISWRADPDPAGALVKMNSQRGATFQTDLKIILSVEVLGRTKRCECKLKVRVDAFQSKIIQVAG